jgi:error-prone DNA polymerase
MVKSLKEDSARRIALERVVQRFASVQDLADRAQLDRADLEALAAAGALRDLSGHRHRAFWEVSGTEKALPLAPAAVLASERIEGAPLLTVPTEGENIVADYHATGLSLERHPLALLREKLLTDRCVTARELHELPHGARVRYAGIVVTRQRPGSASGVTFVTLEDETGAVNLIVWKKVGDAYRQPLLQSRLLEVRGHLQREGEVMHVIAAQLVDRSPLLGGLLTRTRDFQ